MKHYVETGSAAACLGGDEPEEEDIPGPTVVALESGLAEGAFMMKRDLFLPATNEMVHDARD